MLLKVRMLTDSTEINGKDRSMHNSESLSDPDISIRNKYRRYPLTEFIHELIEVTNDQILDTKLSGANLTLQELQEVVNHTLQSFLIMLCLDCGEDTSYEYYMVYDEIWKQATNEKERRGVLCIGCLESRIGRSLNSQDFPEDILLNIGNKEQAENNSPLVSDRLKNRILY